MANITGTNLLLLANSYTEGDVVSDTNGLLWINDFLAYELREKAMIKDTQTYPTSLALTKYTVPTDFVGEMKVEEYPNSSFNDTECYGLYHQYTIEDDKIWFEHDGDYKLTFFNAPTPLATLASDVAIDPVFNQACALYVAYRYLTNDDEDNAANQSLGMLRYQEYRTALIKAIDMRKKKFKTKHRIRKVY